ncbi:MAG: DUF368 domain-containing protein [Flavobacteriales bacterium]
MNKKRTITDNFWLVIKGLSMGAANKVPGVSGGVVAFVVGFYEEFIYSLQKLNKKAVALLFNRGFSKFFKYINGKFLSLLILGMVISYFSVSKILDFLIINYELYVWSAFFGMIVGSIYYLAKDFGKWKKQHITYALCSIILGISISFLEPAKENTNLIFVFFCGIIGVSGMTLPGLSGSFILILLGNYVLLLVDSVNALFDTISEIIIGDFTFISNHPRIQLLKILIVFSLGSLVGLVTFSNLLGYVLKHFKKNTFAIIIGFIIGSLGVVWPWKTKNFEYDELGNILLDANSRPIISNYDRYFPKEFSQQTLFAIFFIILGILIVLNLEKIKKKEQ